MSTEKSTLETILAPSVFAIVRANSGRINAGEFLVRALRRRGSRGDKWRGTEEDGCWCPVQIGRLARNVGRKIMRSATSRNKTLNIYSLGFMKGILKLKLTVPHMAVNKPLSSTHRPRQRHARIFEPCSGHAASALLPWLAFCVARLRVSAFSWVALPLVVSRHPPRDDGWCRRARFHLHSPIHALSPFLQSAARLRPTGRRAERETLEPVYVSNLT